MGTRIDHSTPRTGKPSTRKKINRDKHGGSCQDLCVNSKKLIYKISDAVSKNDR
jgi:hypothetical protein